MVNERERERVRTMTASDLQIEVIERIGQVHMDVVKQMNELNLNVRNISTTIDMMKKDVDDLKADFKKVDSNSIQAQQKAERAEELARAAFTKYDAQQLHIQEMGKEIEQQDDKFMAAMRDYDMANEQRFKDFEAKLERQEQKQIENKRWMINFVVGTMIAVAGVAATIASVIVSVMK